MPSGTVMSKRCDCMMIYFDKSNMGEFGFLETYRLTTTSSA